MYRDSADHTGRSFGERVEPSAPVASLMKIDLEQRESSMTAQDPFAGFKAIQKEAWSLFTPMEVFTTPTAAKLVGFAGVVAGQRLLDVGCGTGVVAITAARRGAKVRGLDLSPVLIERAREHAQLVNLDIDFADGDAESLPYGDNEFDVVLSQFGHMFAPRPDVAIGEMLRVLKPGGTIAFSTWPPHLYVGRMFALVGRHLPPPEGVASPVLWGDPKIVAERLAGQAKDISFEMDILTPSALSPQHFRRTMETTIGPLIKLVAQYKDEPEKLKSFRAEFEALISEYFDAANNVMRQQFLMTRARKV
ncbi:SAM-dependent methyltransferase [Bradyrhizobium genosp. SA-3]|nr:SAM-dependent methyltransferase [Bradyrhizobium genosp. SA-3]